jgi:hypothetical protein
VNLALDKVLVETHPNLYCARHADMRVTAMCWGFSCGDGWFNLLWELSQALEAEIVKFPKGQRPCAVQVKEKYGTLRFYMTGENEAMTAAIRHAEKRSAIECETCGAAGEVSGGGWITVDCERHRK